MEQRRLAAIMFTDMVGYSALAQKNEAQALALLEEHQSILRAIFPASHGTEIKTIGDAFLVEFPSALDAAQCAVAIQKALRKRNEGNPHPVSIRIGLHVGDVVYKENDVFGDGVNIAARIEPLATPGGICCSEDVARQIQNKMDLPLTKLGRADLKNIDLPMSLYNIDLPWVSGKSIKPLRSGFFAAPRAVFGAFILVLVLAGGYYLWQSWNAAAGYSRERIAVLPFQNFSADPSDEYFADGITEELISTLSKISSVSVIARTSVMKYKNLSKSTLEIGRDLMVGTILEGSIRKTADKARISIKLVDAMSQQPIWSDEYDRELKDVFLVQGEIAKKVANELKVQLPAAEMARMDNRGTENMDATRFYFLGKSFLNQRTAESVQKSVEFFDQAIKADPKFALPYAGLAESYTLIGAAGYGSLAHQAAVDRSISNALKAIELDESLAEAHLALAYARFRLEWAWEKADVEFKRALALKSSYAKAHELYALYLALLGRNAEAIPEMQRAMELDPRSSSVGTGLGRLFSFDKQYDRAIEQFNKTIEADSNYAEAHFGLGLVYSYLGQYDRAIVETLKAYVLSGERHVILADLGNLYGKAGRKADAHRVLERFDELSKTTHVSSYNYAIVYSGLGEIDKSFDYFEKAYEEREGLLIYMKADALVGEEMRSNPRFRTLLRNIGLEK